MHSRHRSAYLTFLLFGIIASGCHGYSKEQGWEMQRVRDIVSRDPGSVNRPDSGGNTPLQFAVMNNYLPLMDWLKNHGADPNARGRYGDTALHTAVISDRTADNGVIRALLRMGADVNAGNDYGDTPLHRAAYHGLTDKIRFLLANGADVSRRAQRGETPLLYAARPVGHPEAVLALLKGGAEVDAADNSGITALHGAAMIGNAEVARVLVTTGKANVDTQTFAGYTPLHTAAIYGKTYIVRFLLEEGANPTVRDNDGLTAAGRAVQFPAMRYSKEGRHPVDTAAAVKVLRNHAKR